MGGGLGRVIHHSDYYLSDGSVSFLTGKILFRVHKSYFERESEIFRELFVSAQADDPESGTDKRPFTLDVSAEDFSQFLWVWYDKDYSYSEQSKEKWGTILRLAKRWKFQKIQALAVRELEALELQPAERISLYNEHEIDGEKLLQSYITLCRSPFLPSEAEARLLKMETLIKVLQVREHAQRKAFEAGHKTPTSASLEDDALIEIISKHINRASTQQSSEATNGVESRSSESTGGGNSTTTTSNAYSTIIVQEPQVPDKSSSLNSSTSTSKGRENSVTQMVTEPKKSVTWKMDLEEKAVEIEEDKAKAKAKSPAEKGKQEKDKQEREKQEKEAKKPWGK